LPPRKVSRAKEDAASSAIGAQDMLESFLTRQPRLDVGRAERADTGQASYALVHASELLQDESDYRAALQRWFALVAEGGMLVLTVPHAFLDARRDRLPVPHRPRQRRIYTPASLLAEVEEALAPNSYRLRWLADRDGGYDYKLDRTTPPVGQREIALVLERIAPPAWDLAPSAAEAVAVPDARFEPLHTRAETMAPVAPERILLLKLDHLGDFIMAVPALRAARRHFPDAHITLVVGAWNEGLARRVDVADEVIVFDAYPRNAEEQPVEIASKSAQLGALVGGGYDLAIDLRTFEDTRVLLRDLDATHKAGLGNRGVHPFLDIFLPIDPAAEHVDQAWVRDVPLSEFFAHNESRRGRFHISFEWQAARDLGAPLTFGPYRVIGPGDYLFQPFVDVDAERAGLLAYDVAINNHPVAFGVLDGDGDLAVAFRMVAKSGQFEFRLWNVAGEATPAFQFFGGRLIKRSAGGTLHQSEYLTLLVELAATRLKRGSNQPAEGRR